ncbi:MAG TPA: hypothetical protein VL563_04635 [Gemmatimonadales bacterium]|jgi:hypothetical protein|nr:hypothetical protein [Gemmatimonadales bacterium]
MHAGSTRRITELIVAFRTALLGVVAIMVAATGCAAGAAPGSDGPQSGAATQPAVSSPPVWQVGDRWIYEWTSGSEQGTKQVDVVDIRDVNGVSYYVLRLGDAEHYYTHSLHWAAAIREGRVEARMVPPHAWFQWPLVAGAKWTHQGRFEQRDAAVTYEDRFTVIGADPIEVPAGRYDTLKVVRETDRRDADEYWYASAIRWYVRWRGRRADTQFEERLREYRPAPRPR